MKNPGMTTFAASTTYVHPKFETILDRDDPDFDPDEEEGEGSDYMPGATSFGRWRTPGSTVRVPAEVGAPLSPGEAKDAIQGEIVHSDEQDAADRIIHGEHESEQASANPDVAAAQEDLHTEDSDTAVRTLSDLLRGAHPNTMSPEAMDAAHAYLSRHFTGVTVNPHGGHLVAQSPTGTQVAVRKMNLPAIPEQEAPAPTFSLTNKHGTFESDDPQRIMRAMVAFQIVHNMAAEKKKDDDQDQSGMATTSGIRDIPHNVSEFARGMQWRSPGLFGGKSDKPEIPQPTPLREIPAGNKARFEPGAGTDVNEHGVRGGWVARDADAPHHWERDPTGVAYSPGHEFNARLGDQATTPHEDPYYPGHTFTYAPNPTTGHIHERVGGGALYYADDLHPAVRQNLDLPRKPKEPPTRSSRPAGRMRGGPSVPPHTPGPAAGGALGLPSGSHPVVPPRRPRVDPSIPVEDEDYPWLYGTTPQNLEEPPSPPLPPHNGAAEVNDLCPVCASGYLEPYDQDTHECLNCGSLVKQMEQPPARAKRGRRPAPAPEDSDWFFDKFSAARPKGGLGRGLTGPSRIVDPGASTIGMGLNEDGTVNTDAAVDLDETYQHPLAGEENLSPDEVYQAPRNLGKRSLDAVEEFMGKRGFTPHHSNSGRMYLKPEPSASGAYWRLTEGAPHPKTGERGWSMTLDHVRRPDAWTQGEGDYADEKGRPKTRMPEVLQTITPDKRPRKPMALPGQGNEALGDKSFVASGTHPIEDAGLNRAIRDVADNGRNSQTYLDYLNKNGYDMPELPPDEGDQRAKRLYSSVRVNPGLTRLIS